MSYTGKTKNLGVIGHPIAHSLSPVIQNAALQAAGADYSYIAMPVRQEDLKEAVRGLRGLGFVGFNVTIPHKITIVPLLDSIDENARMIGAVNTVVIRDGQLSGCNTDSVGFIRSLKKQGFAAKGKKAVLLGAGGAARAVIWGLISEGISSLSLGVRNPEKAAPLQKIFAPYLNIAVFHWESAKFQPALAAADLLVNTTPLGMSPRIEQTPPVEWRLISPETFVCDVIYIPAVTKFLQAAQGNGNRILNGEGMLVEQGAAAFRLWLGKEASAEVMQAALRQALRM